MLVQVGVNMNPCKECIVRAMCKIPCEDLPKFISSRSIDLLSDWYAVHVSKYLRHGVAIMLEDRIMLTSNNCTLLRFNPDEEN